MNSVSWADLCAKEIRYKKQDVRAYCTSIQCEQTYKTKKLGVPLDVPKTTVFCPKCSSALLWTVENEKRFAEKKTV